MKLKAFETAFLTCAIWCETDTNDVPLDRNYSISDFDPHCMQKLLVDCEKFQKDNEVDLASISPAEAGHDFWLTRGGHGAGFWDGDYEKEVGERLTESSKTFEEVNLYVGDDGKIYVYGYEKEPEVQNLVVTDLPAQIKAAAGEFDAEAGS